MADQKGWNAQEQQQKADAYYAESRRLEAQQAEQARIANWEAKYGQTVHAVKRIDPRMLLLFGAVVVGGCFLLCDKAPGSLQQAVYALRR